MRKTLQRWLEAFWYKDQVISSLLMPISMIFVDAARLRRFLYRIGLLKSTRLPVPVIIVGNITVGGTGKTPLVIHLAKLLADAGYRPGIISRGYGGIASSYPQRVHRNSSAQEVGDEALVIAQNSACPIAIGPVRSESARLLVQQDDCNVILSDDGLQHYALQRDIEIAVIDGIRRFGNGYCLPVGPLREPISRIQEVDFVVVNGEPSNPDEYAMRVQASDAINLQTNEVKPLSAFKETSCHALAGIGNPDRFYQLLRNHGLNISTRSFPDHYVFSATDLNFKDTLPVLMTEKDAVKCRAFAGQQHWYVPIHAELDAQFTEKFLNLLQEKQYGLKLT